MFERRVRVGWTGALALVAALSVSLVAAAPQEPPPPPIPDEAERTRLPTERPTLRINRLPRAPVLDEFLAMAPPPDLAETMTMVTGFVQRDPADGLPASQRTEVWLGYDATDFHVVFVAFDDDPSSIRARLSPREQVFGDETVEIMLDTFHDQRRAMAFLTNPFGIQWDAIWNEAGSGPRDNFDSAWDTVWHSEGKLTDRGYVVLMSIPFKSLRFSPAEDQTWGIILVRDIPRNNETSFWPRVSNRIEGRLNQAATVEGLTDVSPGRNIWLIPYGAARRFEILDQDRAEFNDGDEYDVGLDAKFVIKDALTLDVAANPDFSQVESDQPQITVNQRFEVFFPERRPFFLENKDFFATPINLVFTRRIRDLSGGARFTGKQGPWRIGALVADDRAPGLLVDPTDPDYGERAWNGVFSLTRDIAAQSNIGMLYTRRDFSDDSNEVADVHGRFKIGSNWDTTFQAAASRTEVDGVTLDGTAYSLVVDRSGRNLEGHIHYLDFSPDFITALGFVPRRDIRNGHTSWTYLFRPEGQGLVAWGPSLFLEHIEDHAGLRLDSQIRPGMDFEWRRSTRFSFSYGENRERLRTSDYPSLGQDTDFDTSVWNIEFGTAWWKTWSFEGNIRKGNAINFVALDGTPLPAEQLTADASLTLRLGRRTRIDGTYLLSALDDPETGNRIFTNQIVRSRLTWQWDPRFSVRCILQYDETDADANLTDLEATKRWNGDLLLTYLINPWTAIYLGYNTNNENLALIAGTDPAKGADSMVVRTDGGFTQSAQQIFLKVTYLFRL